MKSKLKIMHLLKCDSRCFRIPFYQMAGGKRVHITQKILPTLRGFCWYLALHSFSQFWHTMKCHCGKKIEPFCFYRPIMIIFPVCFSFICCPFPLSVCLKFENPSGAVDSLHNSLPVPCYTFCQQQERKI